VSCEDALLASIIEKLIGSTYPDNEKDKEKETQLDLLNSDLSCSICTEVFVKPVKLPCLHTFCKTCILEWDTSILEWGQNRKNCPYCGTRYVKVFGEDALLGGIIEKLMGSTYTYNEKKRRDELTKSHTDLEKQIRKKGYYVNCKLYWWYRHFDFLTNLLAKVKPEKRLMTDKI
jgi:hypothetical protein